MPSRRSPVYLAANTSPGGDVGDFTCKGEGDMKRSLLGLAAASMLVLAACGDDDDDGGPRRRATAGGTDRRGGHDTTAAATTGHAAAATTAAPRRTTAPAPPTTGGSATPTPAGDGGGRATSRRPASAGSAPASRPRASRSSSAAMATNIPGVDFTWITEMTGGYFDCVNDNGGINGRPIEYIAEEEQVDPQQIASLATKLIEQDQVLGIVGSTEPASSAASTATTTPSRATT